MPPVLFSDLVEATVREESLRQKIDGLIALKRQSKENDLKEVDADLVEYACHWAEHFEQTISSFRPEIIHNDNSAQLDGLLREMVMGW